MGIAACAVEQRPQIRLSRCSGSLRLPNGPLRRCARKGHVPREAHLGLPLPVSPFVKRGTRILAHLELQNSSSVCAGH